MKRFPECETINRHPIITCPEKRSKMIFKNPNQREVCRLRVDGCGIQEGLRCDYALTAEENIEEFYIELKGCDVSDAFFQLEASIQKLSDDAYKHPKSCFIISTRCPLDGPQIQIMRKRMQNKYQAKLIIKNREYTHVLN